MNCPGVAQPTMAGVHLPLEMLHTNIQDGQREIGIIITDYNSSRS